jgi:hypothetical protein
VDEAEDTMRLMDEINSKQNDIDSDSFNNRLDSEEKVKPKVKYFPYHFHPPNIDIGIERDGAMKS